MQLADLLSVDRRLGGLLRVRRTSRARTHSSDCSRCQFNPRLKSANRWFCACHARITRHMHSSAHLRNDHATITKQIGSNQLRTDESVNDRKASCREVEQLAHESAQNRHKPDTKCLRIQHGVGCMASRVPLPERITHWLRKQLASTPGRRVGAKPMRRRNTTCSNVQALKALDSASNGIANGLLRQSVTLRPSINRNADLTSPKSRSAQKLAVRLRDAGDQEKSRRIAINQIIFPATMPRSRTRTWPESHA